MRKNRKQKGFTLVEVIVVAVIVAVLAAVAIPLYNGYIRDSRNNVCQNTAASIASAYTAGNQSFGAINASWHASTTQMKIPSVTAGGPDNIINLPSGYTWAVNGSNIDVAGPGQSSASVAYQ